MADVALTHTEPARTTPARATPIANTADRRIRNIAPRTRFALRLPDAGIIPAGTAIGLDLTQPINHAISAGDRTALRLGPDEWLILAPVPDPIVTDATIPNQLRAGLADTPFSLVDISHRQTAVSLTGPTASAMLNALCPLDLDAAAFPVGMATRTVFGKAEITLWRTAHDGFHLEIWRSFAPYVTSLLAEIGREYPD